MILVQNPRQKSERLRVIGTDRFRFLPLITNICNLGYDMYDNYGGGSFESSGHDEVYVNDPNSSVSSWNEFKI